MKRSLVAKTLSFVGLGICFALFQNFSLDHEYRDIREIAPEGVPEEPPSPYLPEHIQSTSLQGLGNEILEHNFRDEVRQFENRFEDWSGIELGHRPTPAARGPAGIGPTAATPASNFRFRTGHLGRDRVGFRIESGVKVKCEYSALKQELQFSVDQPLSQNAHLSFRHTTEDNNSSLNFSYNW